MEKSIFLGFRDINLSKQLEHGFDIATLPFLSILTTQKVRLLRETFSREIARISA